MGARKARRARQRPRLTPGVCSGSRTDRIAPRPSRPRRRRTRAERGRALTAVARRPPSAPASGAIAAALPILTLGIGVGIGRLVQSGGGFDALVAVTLLTWAVYGGFLVLRYWAGWRGRRSASLALVALTLVVATLPIAHFS